MNIGITNYWPWMIMDLSTVGPWKHDSRRLECNPWSFIVTTCQRIDLKWCLLVLKCLQTGLLPYLHLDLTLYSFILKKCTATPQLTICFNPPVHMSKRFLDSSWCFSAFGTVSHFVYGLPLLLVVFSSPKNIPLQYSLS